MKNKDLKKILTGLGWYFLREGNSHEIWTNGKDVNAIPRHREINENTARSIIKVAQANPPKEKTK